jgi:hypothetical protein
MKIHITKAIAPGRNGLSHGIPRFRFFSLKNSVPHFLPSLTKRISSAANKATRAAFKSSGHRKPIFQISLQSHKKE